METPMTRPSRRRSAAPTAPGPRPRTPGRAVARRRGGIARRPAALALVALLTALAAPEPAAASGFYRFQHLGRATGQAGAFTARADDPSALYYNPAAITRLDGLQLAGGLDFSNATDEYSSATAGGVSADHSIQFPPALYLTWRGPAAGPWALGIGIDTPYWYRVDWDPVDFPPRFRTRLLELELWQVHPVVAYELDERWSVGGGVRYMFGGFNQGLNSRVLVPVADGAPEPAELFVDAETSVDGFGFDGAVHYTAQVWGWGAVYRSAVEVEGSDRLRRAVRDQPFSDEARERLRAMIAAGNERVRQSVDLPGELSTGVWFAPYPELRLELDVAWQAWSNFEQSISVAGDPLAPVAVVQRGNWDDTLSLRLGVEGDVGDTLTLYGGVALEPSPVPSQRVDPGFPRGDATVYAFGASYHFPQLSFDLGFSRHEHDSVDVRFQETDPQVPGSYSADDTVWSASARWRF
jgi:long-chain fatty acid transport protein